MLTKKGQEVIIGNNNLLFHINDHNNDLLFHLVGLFVLKQCIGATRSVIIFKTEGLGARALSSTYKGRKIIALE